MRSSPLAILLVLALAACDPEDGTGPTTDPGVRVTPSGAAAPPLAADGAPQVSGQTVAFTTFATARDTAGTLAIIGFEEDGAEGNLFVLQTLDNDPGTYGPCGGDLNVTCHGRYIVGVQQGSVATHDAWYEIQSGQVIITSVADGRVQGSFNVVLGPRAGGGPTFPAQGEFNVPVASAATASAANCFGQQASGSTC
jgi:hypothetical protein